MQDVEDKTTLRTPDRRRQAVCRSGTRRARSITTSSPPSRKPSPARNAERLQELVEDFHEADLGDLLEALPAEDRPRLIELLGRDFDFAALTEVDEAIREDILEELEPGPSPRACASSIRRRGLHPRGPRRGVDQAEILEQLPAVERVALQRSLDYPEDSAGRRMQTEFIAVPPFWTVGQTIDFMRETEDLPETFYEIFVIDPGGHLLGAVPLDKLLRPKRPVTIEEIMDDEPDRVEATQTRRRWRACSSATTSSRPRWSTKRPARRRHDGRRHRRRPRGGGGRRHQGARRRERRRGAVRHGVGHPAQPLPLALRQPLHGAPRLLGHPRCSRIAREDGGARGPDADRRLHGRQCRHPDDDGGGARPRDPRPRAEPMPGASSAARCWSASSTASPSRRFSPGVAVFWFGTAQLGPSSGSPSSSPCCRRRSAASSSRSPSTVRRRPGGLLGPVRDDHHRHGGLLRLPRHRDAVVRLCRTASASLAADRASARAADAVPGPTVSLLHDFEFRSTASTLVNALRATLAVRCVEDEPDDDSPPPPFPKVRARRLSSAACLARFGVVAMALGLDLLRGAADEPLSVRRRREAPCGCGARAPAPDPRHRRLEMAGQGRLGRRPAAGTQFAFIKATEGGDHVDDPFLENWSGAKRAGVPRGAYHFVFWCRPAHEQADWFKRNVPAGSRRPPPGPRPRVERPFAQLPQEGAARAGARDDRRHARRDGSPYRQAADHLHRHHLPRRVLEGEFNDYPHWIRSVAAEPHERYNDRRWTFWQFTTTGRVPGVNGRCRPQRLLRDGNQWRHVRPRLRPARREGAAAVGICAGNSRRDGGIRKRGRRLEMARQRPPPPGPGCYNSSSKEPPGGAPDDPECRPRLQLRSRRDRRRHPRDRARLRAGQDRAARRRDRPHQPVSRATSGRQMGELGLHGITVEEEYGGTGLGYLEHLRRHGGDLPRLGLGRPLLRRPFEPLRQPDPPQRQRGAEAALSAEADLRRACRRARDVGARLRLRRGLDAHARRQARRPLRPQRHQDVDHQRPGGRDAGGLRQDRSRRGPARHHGLPHREGHEGLLDRTRSSTSSACAAPTPANSSSRTARCRRRTCSAQVGKGVERADVRPRLRARGARRRSARHHAGLPWTWCCPTCTSASSSASRSARSSSCRASSPTCTSR